MEINKEACDKNDREWGCYSDTYQAVLENTTIQSSMILYSITRAKDHSRICEVAVGCGLASRMFVSNIMKKNAVYFASDIADGMNKNYAEGFKNSDCALNPKIKYEWIEDSESVNVSELCENEEREIDKKVFHLKANNEELPYPDESFDCYLSSLSLNLVDNHMNQLNESYRVLKEGGTAGFTILGRYEKCNYITFIPDVVKSLGHEFAPTTIKHPAYLGDKDDLEKDMKKVGFRSVKTYYTKINILFQNEMELFKFMANCPATRHCLDKLTEEEMEEFMVEYKKQYDEKFGFATSDPLEWEILVAIAVK
ncbi:unnamed protein product [Moneuplotes crassus]|uniref:Methyltransferase type 11 domain-containing protein n=1 Tax=Euplotes crassus TaxID=5936 RepID=A0AAD1XEZ3_EUPCR|nr:unnamed protein product [Moneuplotes crassus]